MSFKEHITEFFSLAKMSLGFKDQVRLGEQGLGKAFKYFLLLLAACFIGMAVLSLPKTLGAVSGLEQDSLSVGQLRLDAKLVTKEPILIPDKAPFLTLDTTGNKTMDTERFLVTDKALFYNLWNENRSVEFATYDFANSRKEGLIVARIFLALLLPGIFLSYYLAYLLKYLLFLIPFSLVSFLLAKTFKNRINFPQALALSFFAATPMVMLEILLIPFLFKSVLLTKTPFMGVNFSIVGVGLFVIFFVTAIRVNGNRYIS